MAQPVLSFGDVLRIDVMRRVWYAQVISLFGDFLALFAVISVVSFRMHGTPNQITLVQIAYMIGLAFSAIIVPAQTLIQQETPAAMMGRVQSSSTSMLFLAQILGLVLSGGLAGLLGVRLVFIGCAVFAGLLASAGRLFLHIGRGASPTATASVAG